MEITPEIIEQLKTDLKTRNFTRKLILGTIFRKIGFSIANKYPALLSSPIKFTHSLNLALNFCANHLMIRHANIKIWNYI